MQTKYKLFTEVSAFYGNLLAALPGAGSEITMLYFSFLQGDWADRIAGALKERAAAGIRVRLMVDQVGQIVDRPQRSIDSRFLLEELRASGIRVDSFNPEGHRLTNDNRLHAKVCAIDDRTVFIGGSNIGDHYTGWEDANLRIDGALGRQLHQLYDFIAYHSQDGGKTVRPDIHLSQLTAGAARIWLTVPRQRRDIRRAMLRIILDAERAVFIRNWYFLPDAEILDALRSQAERGVHVHVLFSHRTKMRLIDAANRVHAFKLAKSGGCVYRYDDDYAHAKVTWNDRNEILFGSANIDQQALRDNFECCLQFTDLSLAEQLSAWFERDAARSVQQDVAYFRNLPWTAKAFSYLCGLAAPWL